MECTPRARSTPSPHTRITRGRLHLVGCGRVEPTLPTYPWPQVNPAGPDGSLDQLRLQALGVAVAIAWSGAGTWLVMAAIESPLVTRLRSWTGSTARSTQRVRTSTSPPLSSTQRPPPTSCLKGPILRWPQRSPRRRWCDSRSVLGGARSIRLTRSAERPVSAVRLCAVVCSLCVQSTEVVKLSLLKKKPASSTFPLPRRQSPCAGSRTVA